VEIMCRRCFFSCRSLANVSFEAHSNLSRIEEETFAACPSLKSISFPDSFFVSVESLCDLPRSVSRCFLYICENSLKRVRGFVPL
jgi:hypothetical protein